MQVDEYLRVLGHENVFAVGDATDVPETKLGYLAQAQARAACLLERVISFPIFLDVSQGLGVRMADVLVLCVGTRPLLS